MVNPKVGAINFTIRVTFLKSDGSAYDLTGYTVTIVLIKPDGTRTTKSGSLDADPTTGKAYWTTTASSDLDVKGWWRIQGLATKSGVSIPSDIGRFLVEENL